MFGQQQRHIKDLVPINAFEVFIPLKSTYKRAGGGFFSMAMELLSKEALMKYLHNQCLACFLLTRNALVTSIFFNALWRG